MERDKQEFVSVEAFNMQKALEFTSIIEEELGIKLPLKLKLTIALLPSGTYKDLLCAYEKATVLLSELHLAQSEYAQFSENAQGDKSAQ